MSARALIVEDDPSWQQILSELLSDEGFEVDAVNSLKAAVDCLRAVSHRLAVVDLSLGGSDHRNRDGLSVLNAVRQYDPGCKALLLTGYATVELAVSALTEYGAFTCLRKENFQRSAFLSLIRQVFASALPTDESEENNSAKVAVELETKEAAAEDSILQGKVLIVDDDAGWRSILSELLEDMGYQVRQSIGFGAALGCLGRERYDLAVVDLSLSGRVAIHPGDQEHEGYRLLSATRANGIPTLVVSGVATPQDIEYVYKTFEVFTCIEKQNFDRQAFVQTVTEVRKSRQINGKLDVLTERERQVLALLAKGMTNKEIADTLVITSNTVKRHLKAIFEKLEVHTRSAAAAYFLRSGDEE